MPEKDPIFWKALFEFPPAIQGAIMAFVISILRVIYDRQETSFVRVILEGLICGALSLTFGSLAGALGFSENLQLAIGGAIGFMGVTQIRMWFIRKVDKELDR